MSTKGEWWLVDGQAMFADGTIGDYNHSGVVIEAIMAAHDLPETFDFDSEPLDSLGYLTAEERDVIDNRLDARDYALKHLGWKRVAGANIQTHTLTRDDLKDIVNGTYDAYPDELEPDVCFNIEVVASSTIYENVPWSILEQEDVALLLPYRRTF